MSLVRIWSPPSTCSVNAPGTRTTFTRSPYCRAVASSRRTPAAGAWSDTVRTNWWACWSIPQAVFGVGGSPVKTCRTVPSSASVYRSRPELGAGTRWELRSVGAAKARSPDALAEGANPTTAAAVPRALAATTAATTVRTRRGRGFSRISFAITVR